MSVDLAAVRDAGGTVVPDGSGVTVRGWTVQTVKAPILRDADTDQYREELGKAKNTPEQLFADSHLVLRHEHTGIALSFTAKAALQAWQAAKVPPVKVLSAQTWMSTREKDVAAHQAVSFDYDWTYTTDYAGSMDMDSSADASRVEASWEPTSEGMDRSMLMARDPILFWDEVSLYESELDDNGVSQLRVKVRVMPRCWYVLLRFFLRVDKVLVKLRETRLFCPFSTDSTVGPVIREIKYSEGTFEELSKAGAPADGAAYENADSAAMALQAVAPIGLKHLQSDKLVVKQGKSSDAGTDGK